MGTSLGSWYSLVFLVLLSFIQGSRQVWAKGSPRDFYPYAPPVQTIQTEYGDKIDCVDVYRQPAFSLPSLKDHKIEMRPSSFQVDMVKDVPLNSSTTPAKLALGGNETCPEGTVPIFRGPVGSNIVRKSPSDVPNLTYSTKGHEYAILSSPGGNYYGSLADLNIWNPFVQSTEFSLAQIWITAGAQDTLNTIEVGWQVFPKMFKGDHRTRLFVYWTRDGYGKTGCYNLQCPGFVQVSKKFAPGMVLSPVSTYKGTQYCMRVYVYRDPAKANWWLNVGGEWIGYWPSTIYTTLAYKASLVHWGGEITNSGTTHHTATQMGSGHFPSEGGDGVSAYFSNLYYVDRTITLRKPTTVTPFVSRGGCYNIKNVGDVGGKRGYTYFGGPGRNGLCT